ncbi:MAG: hypothetical protein ACKOC4_13780, partial [Planctomycetia bacterium]
MRALRAAAVVIASCCAAAAAGPEPAPSESPQRLAEGHLRRAREHAAASCAMLREHRRHAIDGYYIACDEAWNAVWTCPESPDVLCAAAEVYADALAGLLEAARCHGRLTADGLWIGNPRTPTLVPWQPKALPVAVEEIESIEPQAQSEDSRLTRRHVR